MRRRHYLIIRVVLVIGLVIVGVTLHHRGVAYDAIRGVYLILVVALLGWRFSSRRGFSRANGRSGEPPNRPL